MKDWIENSINSILIQTEKGTLKWENIDSLILVSTSNNQEEKEVFVCYQGERLRVSNPYTDQFEQMKVSKLRDVTVDHFIPINFVINVVQSLNEALNCLIENNDKDKDFFNNNQNKEGIDKDKLKEALNTLLKQNDCILMTQSQNSKKRNNTNYIGYTRNGECDYDFIMAKDLKDGEQEYYVHYSSKNKKPELVRGKAPDGMYVKKILA